MTIVNSSKQATVTTSEFRSTLTLTFSSGDVIEIDASKLTPEVQHKAMMHGLKQKLMDAAAIAKNTDNGRSATVQDKFDAVKEVADRLTVDGAWNKTRTSEGSSNNTLLARALVQMSGKTRAQIDAFLETKTKEEKAALRKTSKVAHIIVALQAEQVANSGIDTDDLLAELDEVGTPEAEFVENDEEEMTDES